MEFACDLEYKGRTDKRYHPVYDKVGWKRMTPVDFLAVKQPKKERLRKRWMRDWLMHGKVKAMVVIHQDTDYVKDHMGSSLSKSLRGLGYQSETRLVRAELCGAATWTSYFVTFAVRIENNTVFDLGALPKDLHLPINIRGCGNIITRHYVKGVTEERFFVGHSKDIVPGSHPVYFNYLGTLKGRPVYTGDGPFPSDAKALILVPDRKAGAKNLRAMQQPEWESSSLVGN